MHFPDSLKGRQTTKCCYELVRQIWSSPSATQTWPDWGSLIHWFRKKNQVWKKIPFSFSEHRWLQCRPFRICTRASSFIFVLCRLLNVITHSCQLGMRGSVFVLPSGELVPQEVNPSPSVWVCRHLLGWNHDVQKVGEMCDRMCVCVLLCGFLGNVNYLSIV